MRKIVMVILMSIFCSLYSYARQKKTRYFDENNIEISKMKFNRVRATNLLLDIPGDSINHKKLTTRVKSGRILNKSRIISSLERVTRRKIDSTKPLVIIYHPGKDPCNSSGGSTSKSWIKNRYRTLEVGLKGITDIVPIYIYKDKSGLKRHDGIVPWVQDPNRMIEKLFFRYHYPCGSFVVIAKNGEFVSRFGEFNNVLVWNATKALHNQ